MASRAGFKIPKPTAREMKDGKLPCPSPSNSEDVVDNIVKKILASDALNLNPTPPLPPTVKFTAGCNYPRWELQARAYTRRLPKEEQIVALLGLLTRDVADRVFRANVFDGDGDDLEATFAQLRELLDTPLHPVEYQTQFHAARQEMGETTDAYAYRVRSGQVRSGF
ncbi:unnamed protein product [Echinostoma caproni]|uniref:Retrotrans_gag domain-containing protein n=1 Tax=Echinostoma caproni TaxID=27848 RepID=A0A183BBY7_9TREM|nr:unnamed protein product [Echinostoma caproni]